VSQKIPYDVFLTFFFENSWEFLVQILHAYYTFLSTLNCKFLFNYLQMISNESALEVCIHDDALYKSTFFTVLYVHNIGLLQWSHNVAGYSVTVGTYDQPSLLIAYRLSMDGDVRIDQVEGSR